METDSLRKTHFSSLICVADMNITDALDQCLADLSLPEVFIQRAKQMSLIDKQGFLGLRPVTRLEESRALLYRINIPTEYEAGVMRRIVEATDLKMGGRGFVISQRINYYNPATVSFDIDKLEKLCGRTETIPQTEHSLVSCIVPRGSGTSLAEAVLELGICVPVIFFGEGVGFRDKLGLMRITVPVEKEVILFIVPKYDADLVQKTLIPRARLDVPGKGFIYKSNVYAAAVNLRIRHGKRSHAATMDQVIAALDEVSGSSEWRRFGSPKHEPEFKSKTKNSRALFFIGEEEEVDLFRRTAMKCGARGATLTNVEMRSYLATNHEQDMASHSRFLCDIITSSAVEEILIKQIDQTGLFDSGKSCVLKTFDADTPASVRSP